MSKAANKYRYTNAVVVVYRPALAEEQRHKWNETIAFALNEYVKAAKRSLNMKAKEKPLRQYTGDAAWFASWKDWNEPDKREFILTRIEELERGAEHSVYLDRCVKLLEEHTRQQKALIEQLLRLIEIQRKEE